MAGPRVIGAAKIAPPPRLSGTGAGGPAGLVTNGRKLLIYYVGMTQESVEHKMLESTVRYLDIEVEDSLDLGQQAEV